MDAAGRDGESREATDGLGAAAGSTVACGGEDRTTGTRQFISVEDVETTEEEESKAPAPAAAFADVIAASSWDCT